MTNSHGKSTQQQIVICETTNSVYLIQCNTEGCKKQYSGVTSRSLKERLVEHRDYVKSIFPTQATGQHFNLPGHNLSNMTITILEKVARFEESYRQEREKILIRKFNSFYRGINRQS